MVSVVGEARRLEVVAVVGCMRMVDRSSAAGRYSLLLMSEIGSLRLPEGEEMRTCLFVSAEERRWMDLARRIGVRLRGLLALLLRPGPGDLSVEVLAVWMRTICLLARTDIPPTSWDS